MDRESSASTVLDFVQWVEDVTGSFATKNESIAPWFRGTNSTKHKLIPSLYRSSAGLEDNSDDELRAEFKRRSLPLVAERPPRDDWEWYFLMQHFGAPTRLLDWTDSALVALYFAVSSLKLSDNELSESMPTVWVLNPWQLNWRLTHGGAINPSDFAQDGFLSRYLPRPYAPKDRNHPDSLHPIAIDPNYIAQRMLVQHSHFTLHGYDPRGLDEMIDIANLELDKALYKIVVNTDGNGIHNIRGNLATLGITETAIYPDLTGLGRELTLEYGIIS